MNLGLNNLNTLPAPASMNSLLASGIEAMRLFNYADKLLENSNKLNIALDNLITLGKVYKKYNGSTEALSILNELTFDDFKGQLSLEGIKEVAGRVWAAIKAGIDKPIVLFKKILLKLQEVGRKTAGIFAADAAAFRLAAKNERNFKPFTYTGYSVTESVSTMANIAAFKKRFFEDGIIYGDKWENMLRLLDSEEEQWDNIYGTHKVDSVKQKRNLFEMIGVYYKFMTEVNKAILIQYEKFSKGIAGLEKEGKVDEAQRANKVYSKMAMVYKKITWNFIKTMMSIATHSTSKKESEEEPKQEPKPVN